MFLFASRKRIFRFKKLLSETPVSTCTANIFDTDNFKRCGILGKISRNANCIRLCGAPTRQATQTRKYTCCVTRNQRAFYNSVVPS